MLHNSVLYDVCYIYYIYYNVICYIWTGGPAPNYNTYDGVDGRIQDKYEAYNSRASKVLILACIPIA